MINWLKLALFIWYYIGWFGCIFLGRSENSAFTVLFPLVAWFLMTKQFRIKIKVAVLLVAFAVVGIIFDALAAHFGWILFLTKASSVSPFWLICLWFLFVTVLPLSFGLLKNRLGLASLLGFIFGPLSYRSGETLAIMILPIWPGMAIYGLFWALFFPTALFLLKHIEFDEQKKKPA